MAPGVLYSHLPPDTLPGLIRQFFRNGAQSRYCSIRFPEWVYDTVDVHGTSESPQTPLPRRILRFATETLRALSRGHWVYFLCQVCYASGWLHEAIFHSRADDSR